MFSLAAWVRHSNSVRGIAQSTLVTALTGWIGGGGRASAGVAGGGGGVPGGEGGSAAVQ